ncbi:ataxin-3-like [Babylonia areolata]|uniref:ataxin-3-like n=1 Tax=Babylonia areolata TaxID=304850 RepID=UPI003FD3A2EA
MEAIFHEKQEGSLCAQHCLNALLQNQYFTAVDLAQLAQNLDEQERQHMLEGGIDSREYQNFLEQPSSNYDDSGFFSIQVLQEALRVWGLELVPFTSQNPIAQEAQNDPTTQKAYICNFRQHWFCVRKLGNQWFNLNSLLTGPELISNTYLSLFLTQLQQEGYSLFVVVGELMESEADQLLRIIPAVQPIKPSLITPEGHNRARGVVGSEGGVGVRREDEEEGEDQYLQFALAESRQLVERDDTALQQALRDSMQGYIEDTISKGGETLHTGNPSASSTPAIQPTAEELRQKRLAYLQNKETADTSSGCSSSVDGPSPNAVRDDSNEEALLQEALRMSMEQPK